MKTETFHFEIITPCFCGGAEPERQAEIRAPSIRGQLRWWFRTLGGFKSLQPMPVYEQEKRIFGSTAGDEGRAGKLLVRVHSDTASAVKDGQELGFRNFSDPAYLSFPIQSRERQGQKTDYAGRGVITEGDFRLNIAWRGNPVLWEEIRALTTVFGQIGSLGFRGRRAMGALSFKGKPPLPLPEALSKFSRGETLIIKRLDATSSQNAMAALGRWLRACRAHGRSGQNDEEQSSPYFRFAKADHDIGYQTRSSRNQAAAFRPALGLPIIQRIQGGTNNWEWDWDQRKRRAKGRFASPVLLRPHKDSDGNWRALVIFVEAHKWPAGKSSYLNGQPRAVSLDLYEAMKKDQSLKDFF